MTHLQFHHLSELQQLSVVDKKGVPIAERTSPYCDLHLFQVEGFYVEIHHHKHFNVVTRINSFADTSLLEPYLQNISIDDLFASA
jgi:threonyl-tRNA synthetase